MLLLDCNDASLRLWSEGEEFWSPGIVWFNEGQYKFGVSAWEQARRAPQEINTRFWHRLSMQVLSPALGPARHAADLVHAHLEALLDGTSGDMTLAIPGAMESDQLSLLLGILQTMPIDVSNVVHRSSLVGGAMRQSCAHVELQLHHSSITVVTVENEIARACETQLMPSYGLLGLMDEIAERIGEQFVAQTRFDPQRRAETEQTLYQQIPDMLQSLSTQTEISCTLAGHTARITADSLRPVGASFKQALTPLLPAGTPHIAMDALLSVLPGLELGGIATTIGPEIIPLVADTIAPPDGELHFQRETPCLKETMPENPSVRSRLGNESRSDIRFGTMTASGDHQSATPVTHILVDGKAKPLTAGAHIADGVAVSASGEVKIETGTSVMLNDQTVEGVVKLNAGDRLNAAGVEVLFIAVEP